MTRKLLAIIDRERLLETDRNVSKRLNRGLCKSTVLSVSQVKSNQETRLPLDMSTDTTRLPRAKNSITFSVPKPRSVFGTFRTFSDVDHIRDFSAAVNVFARLILPLETHDLLCFFRQDSAVHGAVDRLTRNCKRLLFQARHGPKSALATSGDRVSL